MFTDTWTWDDPTQDTRADIERHARASDTYKALDTCLKGYDLVLQNAVSGNKGAMRAYIAFMGSRLAEMHPRDGPICGLRQAHTLNRLWIGIDLTILSLDPMRRRLADGHGLEPCLLCSVP